MTSDRLRLGLAVALLGMACCAHARPFTFSTGNADGKIAAATRPAGVGIAIEAADDFPLALPATINGAAFFGLIPGTASALDIASVSIAVYRVFPLDSVNPPSGNVPTRTNSPADVAFTVRSSAQETLAFGVTVYGSFSANNSVLDGIHPIPNQTTGGDGAVNGNEVSITVTLNPPLTLAAGQYFFVPQVALSDGTFRWLSAPKPIVAPGTPFPIGSSDLQAWIRNATLAPGWLRIGSDIVGSGAFNMAFTLYGDDDVIFRDGFE